MGAATLFETWRSTLLNDNKYPAPEDAPLPATEVRECLVSMGRCSFVGDHRCSVAPIFRVETERRMQNT